MQTRTGCAILAGGKGSRLGGTQKGLIEIGGETLAARLVRLASPLFSEIMLIANEPSLYAFLGVPVYSDDAPGRGPLEGIATALRRARSERVLVMACDMPLITRKALETLASWKSDSQVIAPLSSNGLEPLFALYARSALPVIEARLSAGERKIRSAFDGLNVELLPKELFDPQIWYNINESVHLDELAHIVGQTPALPGHTFGKNTTGNKPGLFELPLRQR